MYVLRNNISAGVIESFLPPPKKNGYIAIFPTYLDRRENGYVVDFPPGKMAI
jgi:hypothetical protein